MDKEANATELMLESHLKAKGAFTGEVHPVVTTAVSTISGEVSYRLKLSIALSELITLTSHMRKNIQLHDGTLVPCNAITFALAGSGESKDSSTNMVRKGLKSAYDYIDKYRKDLAIKTAKKAAVLDGNEEDNWLSYYSKPRDLNGGLGTPEGMLKSFSEVMKGEIGAAAITNSEIGSELQTNGNLTEILKFISVGYDLGKIPAKIIKSNENQIDSIDNLPINALLFGSQDAILYDTTIKAKFVTIFNTQLARRSIFSFSAKPLPPLVFHTVEELSKYRTAERARTLEAQKTLSDIALNIVESTNQKPLKLSEGAQSLFDVYKEYNQQRSNRMTLQYPIAKLSRRHKQWLCLKLSGNFAIIEGNEEISEKNYIDAINIIEYFSEDLKEFEAELIREVYEIFVNFMHHNAVDRKYSITLHQLRKLGYIPTSGQPAARLKELLHLASSYDTEGIYTICNDGICYEEPIRTDITGVSFVEVTGSKLQRQKMCASGYEFYETDFSELSSMLTEDFAYTPFQFKDGVRNKDNLFGTTNWIVLDVDDSAITDEEAHFMLSDINHHIARTSDKDNTFKFRVLIELDQIIDIDAIQWKHFIKAVSNDLAITADILPKAQIYFSYSNREVLSTLDGSPLVAKKYLMESAKAIADKEVSKPISAPQKKTMLNDRLDTFSYAYEVSSGGRSIAMIRAAYHAKDLGADKAYIEDLLLDINSYIDEPLPDAEMENNLLSQVRRWN